MRRSKSVGHISGVGRPSRVGRQRRVHLYGQYGHRIDYIKGVVDLTSAIALVARTYKLEMTFGCKIQFFHVVGTQMIAQGSDGLSRGDMFEGVMQGEPMRSFIPLHKNAFETRTPSVLPWIESLVVGFSDNPVEILSPEGWFERGYDIAGSRRNTDGVWMQSYSAKTFVLVPPPGVVSFSVEELRQARHMRQDSFHIVIIPILVVPEWHR